MPRPAKSPRKTPRQPHGPASRREPQPADKDKPTVHQDTLAATGMEQEPTR
jgi:hypothetical protein